MMLESSFAIVKNFNTGHRAPASDFTIIYDDTYTHIHTHTHTYTHNKWQLSLTDDARVIICDHNMFLIKAIEYTMSKNIVNVH
jgi:hypothetical protein